MKNQRLWLRFFDNRFSLFQRFGRHAIRKHVIRVSETQGSLWQQGGHAGAGIYLARPAIVENCTIVTNSVSKSTAAAPGGLYAGSGSAVTNCIVWGNSIAGASSDIGYAEGASVAYGCAPELAGVATCIASDPCFANPAAGDWTLGPGSPCRDAGARLPWMETALDLAGNRRRVGPPDLGCYESPAPAPLILFLQ